MHVYMLQQYLVALMQLLMYLSTRELLSTILSLPENRRRHVWKDLKRGPVNLLNLPRNQNEIDWEDLSMFATYF